MRTHRLAAVAAALALTMPSCGGSSAPQAGPSATPGGTAWVERYDSGGEGPDVAGSVTVSPDGSAVFVAGSSATLAYRADTGRQLWRADDSAFGRSGGSTPPPTAAVSPDGRTVVVAGTSSDGAFRTVAYDASSGTLRWAASYRGPAGGDSVRSVAVGSSVVLVLGISGGTGTGSDLATVAYDVATGAQRWVARYDGPGKGDELHFPAAATHALALSDDGATAFVTGGSKGSANADYATVAYDVATGAQRWVARYNGPSNGDDVSAAVAVSGGTVFVTGASSGASGADYATVAYDATGRQLWAARYDGPDRQNDGAGSIAVDATGQRVLVAGTSEGATPEHEDYATVAYDASGRELWTARYDGPAGSDDNATSLALSRDGRTAWVTGWSKGAAGSDYATVAYVAATGASARVLRYDGPGHGDDEPMCLAVNPATGAVYVTGSSFADQGPVYATVAYRG